MHQADDMRRVLIAMLLAVAPGCGGAEPAAGADGALQLDAVPADAADAPEVGADGAPAPDGAGDAAPGDAAPPDAASDAALPDAAPDAGPEGWRMPARPACGGDYGGARGTGELGDAELVESSGIVASPVHPDVLWLHNDSGHAPTLYAVAADGTPRGRLRLRVEAPDLEDIAAAPCPDLSGPCLWAADIGNNAAPRTTFSLFVVREPDASAPFGEVRPAETWQVRFRYPEAPVDAEALVVAPDASAFWVIEKTEADRARIFRGVPTTGEVVTLTQVGRFAAPGVPIRLGRMVTGADLHPSGTRLVVRVYSGTWEYRFGPGQGPGDLDAIDPVQVSLGPLSEPQGEAVAYDGAGTGLYTVSESPEGRPGQPLHHYPCRAP